VSHAYRAVGWNRQKKVYDRLLLSGVVLFLALFLGASAVLRPNATLETLMIRGFGAAAFVLLHLILSIGPLCRLDARFLPLLYNRRHMGVTAFTLAALHGLLALMQFHGFGDAHPLISLFTASTSYDSFAWFPFQPLGFLALVILFLMAATSHDFWLANLSAPTWKALHMSVYLAYALLIGHVALGVLQAETSPLLAGAVGLGLVWVVGLHLVAARGEQELDRERVAPGARDFVDVCALDDIPERRARIVTLAGERVAVFRYDGRVAAVGNACQHQNGPLGEGCVIDGLITCPWHGYQYRPRDGASPPPFSEKVPTHDVRLAAGRVLVNPRANAPGTPREPALIPPKPEPDPDA
jgi:nitrite reductase/ring-hydroxylating ferredoxin subunit/DMSO/TMAO reductase YedYZ heme-binding membrane subunit